MTGSRLHVAMPRAPTYAPTYASPYKRATVDDSTDPVVAPAPRASPAALADAASPAAPTAAPPAAPSASDTARLTRIAHHAVEQHLAQSAAPPTESAAAEDAVTAQLAALRPPTAIAASPATGGAARAGAVATAMRAAIAACRDVQTQAFRTHLDDLAASLEAAAAALDAAAPEELDEAALQRRVLDAVRVEGADDVPLRSKAVGVHLYARAVGVPVAAVKRFLADDSQTNARERALAARLRELVGACASPAEPVGCNSCKGASKGEEEEHAFGDDSHGVEEDGTSSKDEAPAPRG